MFDLETYATRFTNTKTLKEVQAKVNLGLMAPTSTCLRIPRISAKRAMHILEHSSEAQVETHTKVCCACTSHIPLASPDVSGNHTCAITVLSIRCQKVLHRISTIPTHTKVKDNVAVHQMRIVSTDWGAVRSRTYKA